MTTTYIYDAVRTPFGRGGGALSGIRPDDLAAVVMRAPGTDPALPWKLLGVHSSRLDMNTRDLALDESLGLNCAWYADILLTLTADVPAPATVQPQQLT